MDSKAQYKRMFYMLNQEDVGYAANQNPSGYIKIEVKDDKGRLQALVQNLKDTQDAFKYRLYMIKSDGDLINMVSAGYITVSKNKGELDWEFSPRNIGTSGVPIEQINIVALIAEHNNKNGIVCPMAAYRDKKVEWKQLAERFLIASASRNEIEVKSKEKEQEIIKNYEIFSKFNGTEIESKYDKIANPLIIEDAVEEDNEITVETHERVIETSEEKDIFDGEEPAANDLDTKYKGVDRETDIETNIDIAREENKDIEKDTNKDIDKEQDEMLESEIEKSSDNFLSSLEEYRALFAGKNEKQEAETSKSNNTSSTNNTFCPNTVNSANAANPCMSCYAQCMKRDMNAKTGGMGDINKLKDNLDKYFEIYDPFGSKKSNYKWWKINSPVYLNNLLYQCDIKTPLLFNPKVLMSHFKYRHLILGIYTDRVRQRQYVVCGIPGVYSLDEKPFGDMCRWVQIEGYKPKYGAFGYWLVYIDPKTGKLLKVN